MSEAKEVLSGSIKISEEVIETIASVAVSEIDGVCSVGAGLVDGIARRLGKKQLSGGIKASVNEETVTVDINIVVKYGARIPEVAWNVQDNVKKSVELMTGLTVDKVNVHVVDIVQKKSEKIVDEVSEEQTEDNE